MADEPTKPAKPSSSARAEAVVLPGTMPESIDRPRQTWDADKREYVSAE